MSPQQGQFTLSYLFRIIFWIAVSLGLFRASAAFDDIRSLVLFLMATAAAGAAVGGLFGKMIVGALIALIIFIVAAILLPAVMVA